MRSSARSGRFAVLLLVAALAAPGAATAQSLASARAFTRELYRAYAQGEPDYLDRLAARTFAPRLLRLIREDAATTPKGEVGALDGDPICDCQDPDGLRLVRLDIAGHGKGGAQAKVRLRFPSETRAMTLDLVWIDGRWRVADVHTRETPSLIGFLEQSLQSDR